MNYEQQERREIIKVVTISILVFVLLVALSAWVYPHYTVWQQGMAGQAELQRAEENRKIKVEEARAKMESAKLLSEAEVERAKGVAKANAIIGDSLQDNEAYLRYLWIMGLNDGTGETIYIPTEAGLPILEAGRGLK